MFFLKQAIFNYLKRMNEVTKFMYYCFNKWNLSEAKAIFGDNLGTHIYAKYINCSDILLWYSELDNECKQKLVDRANEIYTK